MRKSVLTWLGNCPIAFSSLVEVYNFVSGVIIIIIFALGLSLSLTDYGVWTRAIYLD